MGLSDKLAETDTQHYWHWARCWQDIREDVGGWEYARRHGVPGAPGELTPERWMVETFFSGFKRLFGEAVSAKKFERMVKEIELKVWVYNLMLGLA